MTTISRQRRRIADHVTVTGLHARGWTDTLIMDHLGDPDVLQTNPKYRTGPMLRLYAMARVESAEATDAFKAAMRKLTKRRAANPDAGKRAAETKRTKLLAEVDAMRIAVTRLPADELLRRAIESYNGRPQRNGDSGLASPTSPADFLERIQVNYIRHELTIYDLALAETFARVGKEDAISRIQERVFEAIAEAYPSLADESDRQMLRKAAGRA